MSGSRLPLICCDARKPGQPDGLSKSTQLAAENCLMRDFTIAIRLSLSQRLMGVNH